MSTKAVAQKSIVAARDIPQGKVIEPVDLTLLRASGGLAPQYLQLIIGRQTKDSINANQVISTGMLV